MSRVDAVLVACGIAMVLLAPESWGVAALYICLGAAGDQ